MLVKLPPLASVSATLPVPLGANVIAPLAPLAMVIVPSTAEPSFVVNTKLPVPRVDSVAVALLSPIRTLSVFKCTSPVVSGVRAILPPAPENKVILPAFTPAAVCSTKLPDVVLMV